MLAAFRRGLAEAGYVEGKNLTIDTRVSNYRPEQLAEALRDVVHLKVNVIFAIGPEALAEARNATTSIPIVGTDFENDPVAKGYVRTLARPGGNITGMFLDIPELCGNGFRPKRGQHDALDALAVGIGTKRVNFILDADVASFFDSVSKKSWSGSLSTASAIRALSG